MENEELSYDMLEHMELQKENWINKDWLEVINKKAIVKRTICFDDINLRIKKGEEINVVGYDSGNYYYGCEYKGVKFTICDYHESLKAWRENGDENTDILIEFIEG